MGIKKYVALLASATLGLGLAMLANPPANAAVFNLNNNTAITFPNTGPTNATLFPSPIAQFGMSTVITDVNVTLGADTHNFKGDLDIEVVSPQGTALVLMSDACNVTNATAITQTFDDASATSLPAGAGCTSGTFKPTNLATGVGDEVYNTAPTITTLAGFNGENPNGTWRLYVRDDFAADTGAINGWSIQITTAAAAPITIPALGASGSGVASPYPVPIAVSGLSGDITDVDLTIPGFAHTFPADLQMVLQSPSGTAVKLLSVDCGPTDVLNKNFVFDDAAATAPPGACAAGGTFKPTGNPLASMPAPAPAGPFGTTMAAFNGASANANGTWKLFINDTASADGGWISANPTLSFKTTDVIAPETSFTKKPKTGVKTTTKIKFVSSEAGSHFECRIDTAKKFTSCSSPLKLRHLKFGKHKIQVRAIDAAGNVDPTPLRAKWKIIKKN
jgi:subtilisin-like proprotein convertase family protein